MNFHLSISGVFRGLALLLILLLVLALIYNFLPKPSQEDLIEATIAAGVLERSTEVALLTGTPDSDAIQATVEARVVATLTAAAPTAIPTPASPVEEITSGAEGIALSFWNAILWLWGLAGFAGIWSQVCCCVVPAAAIFLGVANDSSRG